MVKKLRPGVVTGPEYIALVDACKRDGYALPAVNVVDSTTASAVLEAAREARSDVIVQISHGGGHFFGGGGLETSVENKVRGAKSFALYMRAIAKSYGVCVALNTDHADRSLVPWLKALVDESRSHHRATGKPLFSSHMLDLSAEELSYNIAESRLMLQRLSPLDISLEMELGCTGGEEDGVGVDMDVSMDNAHLYTQPIDVLQAYQQLTPFGHFSIAASFGNVHGVYKPGNVVLRPDILKHAQELVIKNSGKSRAPSKNPVNFVFHGGSGSTKKDIVKAVSYGVFKMNIDTDTQFANARRVGAYVFANSVAFRHQLCPQTGKPQKKIYDPRKWLRAGQQGIVDRLQQAFKDLGSYGKSIASE